MLDLGLRKLQTGLFIGDTVECGWPSFLQGTLSMFSEIGFIFEIWLIELIELPISDAGIPLCLGNGLKIEANGDSLEVTYVFSGRIPCRATEVLLKTPNLR